MAHEAALHRELLSPHATTQTTQSAVQLYRTRNIPVKPFPREPWHLTWATRTREWQQDGSGLYVLVNQAGRGWNVRIDIMTCKDDEPVVSFVSPSMNPKDTLALTKELAAWCKDNGVEFSTEHALYIGHEIARAAFRDTYKQE